MRLFVGVEIGEQMAAAAAALVDELRRRAQRLAPRARITWISEDRFHLTVRFIGNADEDHCRAIATALAPPLGVSTFELALAGVGAFPRSGKPQVLWSAVVAGDAGLQQIERDVSDRLESAGVARESRPYRPHLTLARVREAAGLRSQPLFTGLDGRSLGTTRVEAITLFESRLSPKGPTYVALQRTALSPA
jgi:2'-5' RNA ligase